MASIVHLTVNGQPRKLRVGSDDEAQIRALLASNSPDAKIEKIEPEGEPVAVAQKIADAKPLHEAEQLAKKRENEAVAAKVKADLNV